jgi:metal-responsive CopG/Arc/MetJ family transcriptional regulator
MSVSLTLPPSLLDEVERLAQREGKSADELMQEAVRRYVLRRRFRELQDYGAEQARNLGVQEEDVERLIHEYRRERRERPGP